MGPIGQTAPFVVAWAGWKGGRFAAFEQPDLFVNDVRAFFRLVR
jgi:hypothetical protein